MDADFDIDRECQIIQNRRNEWDEDSNSNDGASKRSRKTEYECMLMQTRHLDAKVFSGHLVDTIVDEIALEGLDGITVQALKVRLDNRPHFEMEGFEDVATAIWHQLKYVKCLRFFCLPEERRDLIKYHWDLNRDERGHAYEPLHAPEDIYPYVPVEDKNGGIRGSCEFYRTRKDVTVAVRHYSYTEMVRLLGNRLVVVAIQEVRERALLGNNYLKYRKLNIVQYCMMERIGRSRYTGEVTRGKISLTCMKIPPKTLFYNRKTLIKSKLVCRQATSIKFNNCRCPAGITVFHLPRFYRRIESSASLNTRTIFLHLNASQTKSLSTEIITSKYGKHTLRNLLSQFPDLVESTWEQVMPKVKPSKPGKKVKIPKPRTVRVLRLKILNRQMQELVIRKTFDGLPIDDIDISDSGDVEEVERISVSINYNDVEPLRPRQHFLNVTQSQLLYRSLLQAGTRGMTLKDVRFLKITPLESRSAFRFLCRLKVCDRGTLVKLKQKAFLYNYGKFAAHEKEIIDYLFEERTNVMIHIDRVIEEIAKRRQRKFAKYKMLCRIATALRQSIAMDKVKSEITTTNDSDPLLSADDEIQVGDSAEMFISSDIYDDPSEAEDSLMGPPECPSSNFSPLALSSSNKKSPTKPDKKPKKERFRYFPQAPVKAPSSPSSSDIFSLDFRSSDSHSSSSSSTTSSSLTSSSSSSSSSDNASDTMSIDSLSPPKSMTTNMWKALLTRQTATSINRYKDYKAQVESPVSVAVSSPVSVAVSSPESESEDSEDDSSPERHEIRKRIALALRTPAELFTEQEVIDATSEQSGPHLVPVSSLEELGSNDVFRRPDQMTPLELQERDSMDPLEEIDLEEMEVDAMMRGDPNHDRRGDSLDRELRLRMTRQRVDWNDYEDRYILMSFVGSTLFIPKYNFTKVFIYNSTQIRDLLIQKTEGESMKTSQAIRRRLHFLMNQKSYYDVYVGLIGLALRDDFLYEAYVKDHIPPPQLRIYFNPPLKALQSTVEYLLVKFSRYDVENVDTRGSLNGIETVLFIRQLQRLEFYWDMAMFAIFCPIGDNYVSWDKGRFAKRWRKFLGGDDDDEIEENPFRSSDSDDSDMSVERLVRESSENSSPSPNTSQDSSCDDVEVDEDVFEDCQSTISFEDPETLKMDYMLSFVKFLLRQSEHIYSDVYMIPPGSCNKFAVVSYDTKASNPNLCYCARECASEQEIRLWTARCLVLNLVYSGEIARTNERNIVKNLNIPMDRASKSLRRSKLLVCSKNSRLLTLSTIYLRFLVTGLPSVSYDDVVDVLRCIEEIQKVDSASFFCAGGLMAIAELFDYCKPKFVITEHFFTLNPEWVPVYNELVDDDDDDDDEDDDDDDDDDEDDEYSDDNLLSSPKRKRKKRKRYLSDQSDQSDESDSGTVRYKRIKLTDEESARIQGIMDCFEDLEHEMPIPKPRIFDSDIAGDNFHVSSSTNALRLLRMRLNEAGLQMPRKHFTGFVERDFFTINLPELQLEFVRCSGLNHRLAGRSHPYSIEFLKEFRSTIVEVIFHNVPDKQIKTKIPNISKYVGRYAILYQLISLSGRVGLSGEFLNTKFERPSLVKGLRHLLNAKLIFGVGISTRRYVTFDNVTDWLIPIRHKFGHSKIGSVVMRPWITPLGGLSWSTLNQLMISLLGHLQQPSIPFDEIVNFFKPTLSPVEVTILMEALVKLKYFHLYKMREPDTTAFTKHAQDDVEIEYYADVLVDTADVHVAMSPYTTFLHAQFQDAITDVSQWGIADKKNPVRRLVF